MSHSSLNIFLEYGQLPILVRECLQNQVISFIEKANRVSNIRCGLITGEAGSGKTSFVQLLLPELLTRKIISLHIKFYAESETLLSQLLITALNSENIFGSGKISANSITDIVPILRKLSRARLTVIIIEDIHLLNENSQNELLKLIDALADEPITLIGLCRPINEKIRSLIEIYLAEEWKIEGLSKNEITQIWLNIFGSEPDSKLVDTLYTGTKGNALLLRAALRAFIKKDLINITNQVGYFDSTIAKAKNVIQSCSRSVSDAMLLSVSSNDINSAATLAALGEVFSEESAIALIGSTEQLMKLKRCGLVAEIHFPITSISGNPQNTAITLAFTHSIVHERLLKEAKVNTENFLEIVVKNMPIFSYIYFDFLLNLDISEVGLETLIAVFENLLDLYTISLQNADMACSERIIKCGKKIFVALESILPKQELKALQAELTCSELYAQRNLISTQDYLNRATLLMESTKDFTSQLEASIRLNALTFYPYSKILCGIHGELLNDWGLVNEIVSKFPNLRYSDNYISCLDSFSAMLIDKLDIKDKDYIINAISNEFNLLINDDQLPEDLQQGLLQTVGSNLLHQEIVLSNEIEQKKNLFNRLERVRNLQSEILTNMVRFAIRVGDIDEAEKILKRAESEANRILHRSSQINCYLYKGLIAGLKHTSKQYEEILHDYIKLFPNENNLIGTLLVYVAHFRAENKNVLQIMFNMQENFSLLTVEFRLFYAQIIEDEKLYKHILEEFPNNKMCKALYGLEPDMNRNGSLNSELAISILEDDKFLLPIIANKICLIRVFALKQKIIQMHISESEFETLLTTVKNSIQRIADWFLEKKMFASLHNLIKEFPIFIEPNKIKIFNNEIKKNESELRIKEADAASLESKMRVTLMGEITVTHPYQTPNKIRGDRIKTIIGAIVANQIMSKKLSLDEFNSIVTDEPDPTLAKVLMRKNRFRLREIISDEYLIQQENQPLNFDSNEVIIDLVEIIKHLKQGMKLFRENKFIQSSEALVMAFEIAQDKVPFPNLYSEFFESLREDIENKFRAALRVGSKLIDEHYIVYAEDLLSRALKFIPSDDEIAYLLEKSLILQNKQAEAELIRRTLQNS